MASTSRMMTIAASAVAGLAIVGLGGFGLFSYLTPSAAPAPGPTAVTGAAVAPVEDEPGEKGVLDELADAHVHVMDGSLVLDPPSKANADVLASDAVPEKAAPSFFPKHAQIRGAARIKINGTYASVIAYGGEEGGFEVISVKATIKQVQGGAIVPYGQMRFLNGSRPSSIGDVHMVAVEHASRLTFLVGTKPSPKLAELAAMVPL